MKLGIKVGIQKSSISDLVATNTSFCEVWFDINRSDQYRVLFEHIKKNHIDTGLHFWGALPDGTWTNIAYPDPDLNVASMRLIRQTIDIAGNHGFSYVNIHPGSRAMLYIDLQKEYVRILTDPKPLDQAISNFINCATTLYQYAQKRGVVLTVETVPIRFYQWHDPKSRTHPFDAYELPNAAIIQAAAHTIAIANDFGHTAANIISDDKSLIWDNLYSTSKQLAKQTRLIHMGFLVPPFNGTDFHDSLDNPVFASDDAIPNTVQTKKLLQLFQNRPDVWILVEPNGSHVTNYFLAKKLLQTEGVFDS